MAEIGARGFAKTVARRLWGDRAAYRDDLGLRRHERQLEPVGDREPARGLADGAKVACVEMPVLSGPDDAPI
jgi:hypothetical protein